MRLLQLADGTYLAHLLLTDSNAKPPVPVRRWVTCRSRDLIHWSAPEEVQPPEMFRGLDVIEEQGGFLALSTNAAGALRQQHSADGVRFSPPVPVQVRAFGPLGQISLQRDQGRVLAVVRSEATGPTAAARLSVKALGYLGAARWEELAPITLGTTERASDYTSGDCAVADDAVHFFTVPRPAPNRQQNSPDGFTADMRTFTEPEWYSPGAPLLLFRQDLGQGPLVPDLHEKQKHPVLSEVVALR